ncbi:hypothetical protein [Hymenobacter canadensis]|uniref:Agmatinase n=1 Tax=Hymenobacter canadensis TaxID=2999067 RepID=A0ABY7LS55_9BACT|nr:hypothetical protein [Hymenobacter canadensis]WBA42414.1 hypothetical protein O3303_02380 [Hymenobacter canadensis]
MTFINKLIRPAVELPEADVCLVGLPLDFGTVLEGGRATEAAFLAGRQREVRLFEIMELNPVFYRDHQTARLAATVLTAYLTGVAAGR